MSIDSDIGPLVDNPINNSDENVTMPVIQLRETVTFPHAIMPLFVGREYSLKAVERAIETDMNVFLVSQKDSLAEGVNISNMESIGTIGSIIQYVKLSDDTLKILIDVRVRAIANSYVMQDDYIEANLTIVKVDNIINAKTEALIRTVIKKLHEYVRLSKRIGDESMSNLEQISDPDTFADMTMCHLTLSIKIKKEILAIFEVIPRLERIARAIESESDILLAEQAVQERLKGQIDKSHREYYLNEQMKAIRRELGNDDGDDYIEKYKALLAKVKLSDEAREKASDEIKRLGTISQTGVDVVRAYLDLMFALPWNVYSETSDNLIKAEAILSKNHYGMEKIKEIIVEYLAIQLYNKRPKISTLCLYGPPGVGKTTLAKSIADAMGRKYAKISLGGVRDEAEIRGHRRTYVGALPGGIIQAIKRAGTSNPVILLDEIDKISSDGRGDPASALLEVLDQEQNNEFHDHYLEVGYDISNVMFIATANSLAISPPLRDRLDIINVPSYLEQEKLQICKRHLLPKQIKLTGLETSDCNITDNAILEIIRSYTRESGVRELERLVGKISRKILVKIMKTDSCVKDVAKNDSVDLDIVEKKSDEKKARGRPKKAVAKYVISTGNLQELLGVRRYCDGDIVKKDMIGVTNGLAYTRVGGDILQIEAVKISGGKGLTKVTGKLGDVMLESAQAAMSYIKSRYSQFGFDALDINGYDIHIHVPDGATPKDGPSAGIAICTTIMSLLSNIPVNRKVAMTGEITLTGSVLPIGGLQEKMSAAVRAGIKIIIIPADNAKDLEDVPEYIKKKLDIHLCSNVEEVFTIALVKKYPSINQSKVMIGNGPNHVVMDNHLNIV